MNTRIFIIIFIIFFTPYYLLAQNAKKIKGMVFSMDSTLPLSGISILNLNLKTNTISDKNGAYIIEYNPNDTIEFSHENWETTSIIGKNLTDSIFLLKKSIKLDEVIVMGDRAQSRADLLENQAIERNKKNAIYYNGRPPISLLNPFGGKPITLFYELLSKSGRKARKMGKGIAEEIALEKINKVFNADLITSIVPIEEEDLNDFMENYSPSAEQVENWTTYDTHTYIKNSFKSFIDQQKK